MVENWSYGKRIGWHTTVKMNKFQLDTERKGMRIALEFEASGPIYESWSFSAPVWVGWTVHIVMSPMNKQILRRMTSGVEIMAGLRSTASLLSLLCRTHEKCCYGLNFNKIRNLVNIVQLLTAGMVSARLLPDFSCTHHYSVSRTERCLYFCIWPNGHRYGGP